MSELDDFLEHAGVKGMKWGVRRNSNRPGGADGKSDAGEKKPGKLKQHLNSLKRERDWKKVRKNIHEMSTKDINKAAQRIQLENDLKRLSRQKGVGSKKDKQDYLRREKMSDQELSRKVNRLRAKNNLNRTIDDASKEQRELGAKVVQVAGGLALGYAMTGKVSTKDVYRTLTTDVKSAKQQAKQEAKKRIEEKIPDITLIK